MKTPRAKASLKPTLKLYPDAQRYFKAISDSVPLEREDALAATLAACALAGFEKGPSLELLAECRAWLSELGMTPASRARKFLLGSVE